MNIHPFFRRLAYATLLAVAMAGAVRAQWKTETLTLHPGWNAVYLQVDAQYDTLENLVGAGSPISEIWLWQPNLTAGRILGQPVTLASGSDWLPWAKATGPVNAFPLAANSTYLVRNDSSQDYTWNLKGTPVPPSTRWSSSGLNFRGFATRKDAPPLFTNFLAPTKEANEFEIYQYPGGENAQESPLTVPVSPGTENLNRGQAYWIRKSNNSANNYFGPFEVVLQNQSGIAFSDRLGAYSFRLRNQLDQTNKVTITLSLSETSPTSQAVPPPPLLLRTTLSMTTLLYSYKILPLNQVETFDLAPKGQPGSEVEVVLGLDRSAMNGASGDKYAAILRLQDATLGQMQVDLPVTAQQASSNGLWVGDASITRVGNYLKTYAKVGSYQEFTNKLAQPEFIALNEANQTVSYPPGPWTSSTVPATPVTPTTALPLFLRAGLASSADGMKLVGVFVSSLAAGLHASNLATSTDGGATWTERDIGVQCLGVVSSADGRKLVVAGYNRDPESPFINRTLYTSSDAGETWAAGDSGEVIGGINLLASSSDGTRLVAAGSSDTYDHGIFTSSDAGVTWQPSLIDASLVDSNDTGLLNDMSWNALASSDDGLKLVVVRDRYIITSKDGGLTWSKSVGFDTFNEKVVWSSVASSDDGTRLVALGLADGGVRRVYTSTDAGTNWFPHLEYSHSFNTVASSADGMNLVAASASPGVNSGIYTSVDAGMSWVRKTVPGAFRIVCSADGLRITASPSVPSPTFRTSRDGGEHWNVSGVQVRCVASSADGTKLVAGVMGSHIARSVDSGSSWTAVGSAAEWQAIASSADGSKLVAVPRGGRISLSSDTGTNWSEASGTPVANWIAVTCSTDGRKIAAVTDGTDLYTSVDQGNSWIQRQPLPGQRWRAIAGSSDGIRLLAAINGGPLVQSLDSGATWKPLIGVSGVNWQSVASSADGKVLVAVENPGGLYFSTDSGTTWEKPAAAPQSAYWQGVTCSRTGTAIVGTIEFGKIYASGDRGKTWSGLADERAWTAVATSADGSKVFAGTSGSDGLAGVELGNYVYTTTGILTTPELTYDKKTQMVMVGGGKYLQTSFDTDLGTVASPFPLRLIIHQGSDGHARLLPQVFQGADRITTNPIVTVDATKLHPAYLSKSRRLSAVHLPLSTSGWPLQGALGQGRVSTVLKQSFADEASNPFLHSYHPDHDNLDALYQPITKPGVESYDIDRQITLEFTLPGQDFASRTAGSSRVQGLYSEAIVLKGRDNQTRTIVTQGSFILNRISDIPTLQ